MLFSTEFMNEILTDIVMVTYLSVLARLVVVVVEEPHYHIPLLHCLPPVARVNVVQEQVLLL